MIAYLFEEKIKVMEKYILIKSKDPITPEVAMCVECAFVYVYTEYQKLGHIMNQENRVLEAKYNAIEALQSDCESPADDKACETISQYIINLEI
jgi:hypothetical protein